MKKILSSNRSFGILLFFILLLAHITLYRFSISYIFWASLIVLMLSIIYPTIFKIPNILWIKFGLILAKLINPIICTFLYFFVIGGTRIILELFGKKLINKTKQTNLKSYWVMKENKIKQSLDDQF